MKRLQWNRSPWMDAQQETNRQNGSLPSSVDVCVVGAGVAGLSVALQLARAGRSVLVLDDGPIGGGQTAVTTAHLSSAIDDGFKHIERIQGSDAVRLAYESHSAAIYWIKETCETEQIACDFALVEGFLYAPNAKDAKIIDQEWEAIERAGLKGIERIDHAPIDGLGTGPSLRYQDQAQFQPLKYLDGLTRAIERVGGKIVTGQHVSAITGGSAPTVEIRGEPTSTVSATAIVVATNSPIHLTVGIHTKQAPYTTYAIGLQIPRGLVPKALFWDTDDPYHYVRTQPIDDEHDLLIVGGEDHKTAHAHDAEIRFAHLEEWARARFPQAGEVTYHWSGQVFETLDGLGYIGKCPSGQKNLYIVTGDSGMGLTHGTIAGMLISDLILGRSNAWESLYEPSRKPLKAAWDFVRENVDVALQFGDRATGGEVTSVDAIPPGSGAIIGRGTAKVAVYRNDGGILHECSAICPHLGCIVAWNPAARTWDCPCHGSRFDALGIVIVGPANTDLAPASTVPQKQA